MGCSRDAVLAGIVAAGVGVGKRGMRSLVLEPVLLSLDRNTA